MRNHSGFTLLELLVAATIIGILAVFATVSYKNSAGEARIAAAKTRAEVLAGAVQRYNFEYRNAPLSGVMASDSKLVTKGFVEKGGWNDGDFVFTICGSSSCSSSLLNPLVCLTPVTSADGKKLLSKLPARYQGKYKYCVSATKTEETFN